MKERLGVRRYLRYCDDMVLAGDDKGELQGLRGAIEAFGAGHLRLRFNPRKCFVAPVSEGLRLLGYRVYPDRIRRARGNVTRARRRLRDLARRLAAGQVPLENVHASVQAWIGHAGHADSRRIRERILGGAAFRAPALQPHEILRLSVPARAEA